MGTPLVTKPPTPAQRAAAALQRAAERLVVENDKLLAAALTELAVETVLADRAFAERVRARYSELSVKATRATPTRQPRAGRTSTNANPSPKPKVSRSRTAGDHVDIVSPVDPRTLVPLYGANLPAHLTEYSDQALWQMTRVLAAQAGTKAPPKSSGTNGLIAYILRTMNG